MHRSAPETSERMARKKLTVKRGEKKKKKLNDG